MILVFGFVCVVLGFCAGLSIARTLERNNAIAVNVGSYASDPVTGETKFYYGVPRAEGK